jgi:hypothetical protein
MQRPFDNRLRLVGQSKVTAVPARTIARGYAGDHAAPPHRDSAATDDEDCAST